MDELTKGTWIINSIKQIKRIRSDAPELSYFEATEIAGKAGTLLSRLVADEQEIVSASKVKAFARASGITAAEQRAVLNYLKDMGKVDFSTGSDGKPGDVEVYSFSTQDALRTTSSLYEHIGPSEHEEASLVSLEATFQLPRFESELIEAITNRGLSEEVAETTLRLQDSLQLARVSRLSDESLFYNEHAFAGDPEKIARALKSLTNTDRQSVQDIQHLVETTPGLSYDLLANQFPDKVLKLMEGVGLLDALRGRSDIGEVVFATVPQLQGISIGQLSPLSVDVFHKAKILLSCLRFGEVKSESWRGKIDSPDKMMNIVNKLVRGEWVGPATAIGQDYQLLERDGVIITKSASYSRYFMQLRQKEVGLLVKQMLEFNRVIPEADTELQRLLEKQATDYIIPEHRRSNLLAQPTKPVNEARENLLRALRT